MGNIEEIRIVVTCQVAADSELTLEQIQNTTKEAIENAVRQTARAGFVHSLAEKASVGVVYVEVADSWLKLRTPSEIGSPETLARYGFKLGAFVSDYGGGVKVENACLYNKDSGDIAILGDILNLRDAKELQAQYVLTANDDKLLVCMTCHEWLLDRHGSCLNLTCKSHDE